MRHLAILTLLALTAPAMAQGIVLESIRIDPDRRPTRIRRLPMRLTEHTVKIVIDEQVARTDVVQIFHNPNPWPIEGVYLFPLPEGAAVGDFTMSMGGKQVTGEILDAKRARDIYRSVVRRRDDPGLLEYAGRRAIRARLFPIPARSDTRVTLSFGQVLKPEGGVLELTYPMRSEAFGHGRVKMAGEIEVKAQHGIANLFSPTHKLDVVRKTDARWIASFEEASSAPDRDLQLLYTLGNKEFGLSLLTHKEAAEDGYFLMLLSPRTSAKRVKVLPKDVVYALDTSGSMGDRGGVKLQQAKKALTYALGRLRPEDRFNIVTFATEARPFREGLIPATPENVKAAIEHVDKLVATGGTAMHDALVQSLSIGRPDGRVPIVIFLTDGQPTIGPVDPRNILAAADKANSAKARLFVFGVGYDVHTTLLTDLADAQRGSAGFVTEKEDIEIKVSALVDKVASPVLTDAVVSIDGVETRDLYPQRVGDLFSGQQVVLVGRYRGAGSKAIRLRGKLGSEEVNYVYEANFGTGKGQEFLPQLWGVRRVGFLMGEVRKNGEKKELIEEIKRLGIKYGIVTPYTSFLVVDERELMRRRLRPATPGGGTPQPPEVRARLEETLRDLDVEEADEAEAKSALDQGAVAGRGAVRASRKGLALKKVKRAAEATGRGVKRIDSKTFRFVEGRWTDLDLLTGVFDGPEVRVKYLSDEYMKLLENDRLARLLSVGADVRVVFEGTLYVVESK
ncbi:MAG: VIT and vWA domain-containing protein [Planctomycetota bacterium]|jgi:Ca-activated chloride channel family protein